MEKNHKPYINEAENARIRKIVDFAKEEGLSEPVDLDTFRVGYLYGLYYGGWCSVKDELPEFGERVLIVSLLPSGYREIRVANLFQCRNEETGEETTSWTNPVKNETVTHWMPLPEPPEED
jgi:hypothetical protein